MHRGMNALFPSFTLGRPAGRGQARRMTLQPSAPSPVIVRAGDSAEFLSLIPHLAGCHPRDSVVLVPFADKRTLGALRVDLPGADEPDPAELAASFIGLFTRVRHANRIAIVVYTEDGYRDERGRIARATFVEALVRCAEAADYAVVDALCVAADAWGSYLEPDGPYSGSPLDLIRPEDLDFGDGAPLADQHAGLELPPSDADERERVAQAIRALTLNPADPELPLAFEDAVTSDVELSTEALALLVLALERPAARDIALSQWCGDLAEGREVQQFNVSWLEGTASDFRGPLRLAGEGPRPDPVRLRRALEVTKKVASVAPPRLRTGVLASTAWLCWALGSSTHAAHYVRLAQEINSAHGLANIVATMIRHAHLPSWALDRAIPGPPPKNRDERRRWAKSRR
ncbi:DUF4192 family protein [Microbacterium paludicola]|uniref:DUF4192 family protein n=2 Tax=Microbacterium paludicola TaxID=300019 RepID=A0A4Y9FVA8_9MICO|nr:DUF4192 family protein [Microbacterium paludicola]